mmetsp:Transcript_22103/g.61948  ORF Transcript_22103/g.61948 Transcript_22103/m.61948 type:complete len:307 (+) Transcript_22103:182-1102(+)
MGRFAFENVRTEDPNTKPVAFAPELSRMTAAIVLQTRSCTDARVHRVRGVHPHPPLLGVLGRRVLGPMPMLRRQFPTCVLDGMFDVHLRNLDIHSGPEGEILMVHIASEVAVDPPILDWVLLLRQYWVAGEVFGECVIDRQALHTLANCESPERWGDHEAEQRGTRDLPGVGTNVVIDLALGFRRYELVECCPQSVHFAVRILPELHEAVVRILFAQLLQRGRQWPRKNVIEPIQELVANDAGERQRHHLDRELQIPQRLQILHADELDHLDQDAASPVDPIEHLAVHVLATFRHAVLRHQRDLPF